jgi:Short C-terminal domain
MSLTDELTKLAALRQSGALTETEFQQAKAKLLGSPPDDTGSPDTLDTLRRMKGGSKDTLGEAANRYVSFQMIMAVVGILIFLFFFAPVMCRQSAAFGGNNIQLR